MCQACFTGFVDIMLMQGQSVHCWTSYQTFKLISATDWCTCKVYFVFWVNHVAFKLHRLFTFLPPKRSVYPKALHCTRVKQHHFWWMIDRFPRGMSQSVQFNTRFFLISNPSFQFRPRVAKVVCLSQAKSCLLGSLRILVTKSLLRLGILCLAFNT